MTYGKQPRRGRPGEKLLLRATALGEHGVRAMRRLYFQVSKCHALVPKGLEHPASFSRTFESKKESRQKLELRAPWVKVGPETSICGKYRLTIPEIGTDKLYVRDPSQLPPPAHRILDIR